MKKNRGICLIIIMIFIPLMSIMSQVSFNINDLTIPKSRTAQIASPTSINSSFKGIERIRPFFSNRNLSTLNLRNRGDILILDFFEDKRYQAVIEKVSTDGEGLTSVTAKISGMENAYCYMTISGTDVSVMADIPELDEEYFIGTTNGSSYVSLYRRSTIAGSEPVCGFDEIPENRIASRDLDLKSTSTCLNTDLEANVTIDLMIVYTPATKAWAASNPNTADINSLIATIVSKSNQVMLNSKTGVTFRLVHKHEVNYKESGTSKLDLDRLRLTSDGYMEEVHTLKKEYGADFIMLLGRITDYGGMAYLPGSVNGSEAARFSLVEPSYALGGYTAVHEMGHNFGCNHHRDQGSKGLFSYSTGWRGVNDKGKSVCTVMPYAASGQSRIPYFSSPDIIADGVVVGSPNYEDNALTIKRMKCVSSKYAESATGTPPPPTQAPPVISITSPTNGATVNTSSVNVTANASDTDGTITKVEFYLNGALKSTDTSSPYAATLTPLNTGSNTIMTKAFDSQGLTASSTISVTYATSTGGGNQCGHTAWSSSKAYNGGDKVYYNGYIYEAAYWSQNSRPDQNYGTYGKPWKANRTLCESTPVTNTPPVVSITSPTNGIIVNNTSLNVEVNASDADGSVSKVEFFLNGTLKNTDTSAPYAASVGTLSAGQNTIMAKVFDDKGANTMSSINIIYFAPVRNIRAVETTTTSIDLTWESGGTTPNISYYNVYDATQNKYLSAPTSNRYLHTGLTPNTEYSYYVRAYTAAGEPSDKSEIFTVKTKTDGTSSVPPTVSITTPANGATINTPSVNVTANASASNATISKVEFYLNDILKYTDIDAPYTANSVGILNQGANIVKAKAYDSRGETAESSITINYGTSTPNIPPTVAIITPANGVTVNTGSINVKLIADDSDGLISKVEIYLNGILKSTLTSTLYDITLGALQSGANTIMAKAYDDKGATTTSSIIVNYVTSTGDDCMGVAAWQSNKVYNAGDKAKDNGVIYKADYWNQNNQPSLNHGSGKPWSVVSKCDGTIDAGAFGETQICNGIKILVWKAEDVYDKPGIQVVYQSKIYRSNYWTKGNVPSNSSAWTLVGTCK